MAKLTDTDDFPPRSIFGIETERAVRKLRRVFKDRPWYLGVGCCGGKEQAGLIIYTRSDDHPELDNRTTLRGFAVTVQNQLKLSLAWREQCLLTAMEWLP